MSMRSLMWALLAGLYFSSRLINLRLLPLFIDEGVYLWWGDRILQGDLLRGLGEGKPLVGWLIALALALGTDPLIAPRLVHVILGGVICLSVGLLAKHFFSWQAALVAAALWIFLPYALFFERLATPDVALAAMGMLTTCLSVRLAEESVPSVDRGRHRGPPWLAWTTGVSLVATMMAKMPVGVFFVIAPVISAAALHPHRIWRRKMPQLAACYALPGVFLTLATAVVLARWRLGLRPLGFGLQEVLVKGALSADSTSTLDIIARNSRLLISWLSTYLTWPLAGLLLVAWLAAWVGRPRALRLLALVGGLYVTLFVFASGTFLPRYLFPALPPLVIVLAWALTRWLEWLLARTHGLGGNVLSRRNQVRTRSPGASGGVLYGLGAVLVLTLTTSFNRAVLFHPDTAPLPEVDRHQYVEGMGSGYGLAEAAAFLDQIVLDGGETTQIVTLHVGDYERLAAYASPAVRLALRQVHIVGDRSRSVPEQIDIFRSWLLQATDTYVVGSHKGTWSTAWSEAFPQARLVRSFPKPGGKDAVEVYLVEATAVSYGDWGTCSGPASFSTDPRGLSEVGIHRISRLCFPRLRFPRLRSGQAGRTGQAGQAGQVAGAVW